MSNKNELDKLVEIYFNKKTESTPTLNLDMLVEMIENMYPCLLYTSPSPRDS